jgi:hypothetical protein
MDRPSRYSAARTSRRSHFSGRADMGTITARAAILDFTIEPGTDYSFTMAYLDDNGQPVDLSPYIGRLQIRRTVESTTAILSLSSEDADPQIEMSSDSSVTFTLTNEQTTLLSSLPDAVWDFEIEDDEGVVTRWWKGVVTPDTEVTR